MNLVYGAFLATSDAVACRQRAPIPAHRDDVAPCGEFNGTGVKQNESGNMEIHRRKRRRKLQKEELEAG